MIYYTHINELFKNCFVETINSDNLFIFEVNYDFLNANTYLNTFLAAIK